MGKIAIVTDTNLPAEFFSQRDIMKASMKIHFDDEEFTDQVDISHDQFYTRLEANVSVLPRTTQPQPADFLKIYRDLRDKEITTVFSLHISAKMSGTVQASQVTAEMVEDMNVLSIDTAQVGPALGLFVYAISERLEKGATCEDIQTFIHELIEKRPIKEIFTVNSMDYLAKNSRVGKAKGLAATLLNIKPILTIKEGEIAPLDKARGHKALINKIVGYILQEVENYSQPLVFAAWRRAKREEEIDKVISTVNNKTREDIKVMRGRLAPTIACHSGPEVFSFTIMDQSII